MKKLSFFLYLLFFCTSVNVWAINYGHVALKFYDAPRTRNIDLMVFYPSIDGTEGSPWFGGGQLPVFLFAGAKNVDPYLYRNYGATLLNTAVMVVVGTTADTTIDEQTLSDDMISARQYMLLLGGQSTSIFSNHIGTDVYCAGHSLGGGAAIVAARTLATTPGVNLLGVFCMAPSAPAVTRSAVRDIRVRTLILAGTQDCIYPSATNAKLLYDSCGAACKTIINMIGGTHCKFVYADTACKKRETGCNPGSIPTNGQEYFSTEYLHFFMLNSVSRPYSQPLTTLESFFSIQSTRPAYGNPHIIASKQKACEGDTIVFSVDTTLSSYYWTPGGITTPTYTVIAQKNMKVELLIPDPCFTWTISGTTLVGQIEKIVHLTPDPVCEGNPQTIGVANYNNFSQFLWSTGETSPTITVTKAGVYTVRVSDDKTCANVVDSFRVQYTTPERCALSKRINATLCDSQMIVTIYQTNSNHTDYSNYRVLWSNGDTSWTTTIAKDGNYSLWFVATDRTNGCKLISDTIALSVKTIGSPKPTITRNGTTLHCSHADYYQWMRDGIIISGATDQDYVVSIAGRYSVLAIYDPVYQCTAVSAFYDFILDVDDALTQEWSVKCLDNILRIRSSDVLGTLRIFNIMGQCVFSTSTDSQEYYYSTEALAAGAYILEAERRGRRQFVIIR